MPLEERNLPLRVGRAPDEGKRASDGDGNRDVHKNLSGGGHILVEHGQDDETNQEEESHGGRGESRFGEPGRRLLLRRGGRAYVEILDERVPLVDYWNDGQSLGSRGWCESSYGMPMFQTPLVTVVLPNDWLMQHCAQFI